MKDFLVYTYCLTKNSRLRLNDIWGMDNKKVYQIVYQDLAAVVSQVKREEFNKKTLLVNLKKPKWAEKRIRTHAGVILKVMGKQTVLPVKFGTIFKNDEGVKKMLRANRAKFLLLLEKFKDKQEWGVKIYADRKKFEQYLKKTDEEFKKIEKQAKKSASGQAYLLEKKSKEVLEGKIAATVNQCASKIFQSLGKKSEASRLNKNLPPSLSGKKKEMILNSVYLINKANFDQFSRLLNSLLKKYRQFGLEGEFSGPWPVYSFL